jgi:hypothetical protein
MSDAARRELEELLCGPVLLERWPDGLTTDDVLAALAELGTLALGAPCDDRPRYRCRLLLHDGSGGCAASGLTLTAAAVRCLLEAEADISAHAAAGMLELQRHLGAAAEPDVTS